MTCMIIPRKKTTLVKAIFMAKLRDYKIRSLANLHDLPT